MKRVISGNWRIETGWFGWGVIAFFAAAFMSGLMADDKSLGLRGAWDVFRFGSIFFLLINDYCRKEKRLILFWLIILGTLAGVIWGITEFMIDPERIVVRIRNVGDGNHSGFYIAEVLCLSTAALILRYGDTRQMKVLLGVVHCILLGGLFLTQSRSAFLGYGVFLIYLFFRDPKYRRQFAVAAVCCLICFAVIVTFKSSLREKMTDTVTFECRYHFWRAATLAYLENPVFGTGPNHYQHMDFERYGIPEDFRYSHPHSLPFKVISEFGTIGVIAFLFMLYTFTRQFRSPPEDKEAQIYFCGAVGAMAVILGGGLFNTTLHHETAMVFSLLLGLSAAGEY
ncbi:O-antigen ligase family protein [Desulfobacterales bacterium HSG2]|nr:O-antigen ligase family protein [Desulfobacterales bacterium HSG2]